MQKTNMVILTAVVLGLSADVRAAVAVTNAGFEAPAVVAGGSAPSADGWSGTGGNGVAEGTADALRSRRVENGNQLRTESHLCLAST
jgi:hypothetical protein